MTMTATVPTETDPVFLQLEYCDACSAARGMYRIWIDRWNVELERSLDVVLCGHHFNAHETAIIAAGYEVDEI